MKTIKNNDKLQRRIDSLARVLGPQQEISPSTAVALVEDKIFIALNTPKDLEKHPIDIVKQYMEKRLALLRDFLSNYESPDQSKKTALDYVYHLRHEKLGGTAVISSKNETRNGKKTTINERLVVDLLKLGEFYKKSPRDDPEQGFSQTQIDALMKSKPLIFHPNSVTETRARAKVHADQLLPLQIERFYKGKGILNFDKVTIGINKLSCQTCESVLDAKKGTFSYRGASGILYPYVVNMLNNQKSIGSNISSTLREDLNADNSDSEPEDLRRSVAKKSTYTEATFFKSDKFGKKGKQTDLLNSTQNPRILSK